MTWKFDNTMITNGFRINECDKCIYIKNTKNGYVLLCLYVNDILIVGCDNKMIKSTKNMLKTISILSSDNWYWEIEMSIKLRK